MPSASAEAVRAGYQQARWLTDRRFALAVALTGTFLVVGMRATLLAHTLATAVAPERHSFGSDGTGSALAVRFSNDFVAHKSLSSLIRRDCHTLAWFIPGSPLHPPSTPDTTMFEAIGKFIEELLDVLNFLDHL